MRKRKKQLKRDPDLLIGRDEICAFMGIGQATLSRYVMGRGFPVFRSDQKPARNRTVVFAYKSAIKVWAFEHMAREYEKEVTG